MRRSTAFVAVLLFGVAGCADDPTHPAQAAGDADALFAAGATALPIQGEMRGTVARTLIGQGPEVRLDVSVAGQVSHLGRSAGAITFPSVTIDLVNRLLIPDNTTWTATLTAANGDQIFGTYTLRTVPVSFGVLGDLQLTADLAVTGGTGRFAGASGSGVAAVSANVLANTLTVRFRGTLDR